MQWDLGNRHFLNFRPHIIKNSQRTKIVVRTNKKRKSAKILKVNSKDETRNEVTVIEGSFHKVMGARFSENKSIT